MVLKRKVWDFTVYMLSNILIIENIIHIQGKQNNIHLPFINFNNYKKSIILSSIFWLISHFLYNNINNKDNNNYFMGKNNNYYYFLYVYFGYELHTQKGIEILAVKFWQIQFCSPNPSWYRTFPSPQKMSICSFSIMIPHSQGQCSDFLLNFACYWISHKWNHRIYFF